MNEKKDLKQTIVNHLIELVNEKIDIAIKSIHSAKDSRDNETKSSVGDKYETGRAMIQFELEKHTVQLQKAQQQKHELSQINLQKEYNRVEFGSLVFSDHGNYFIAIGLGKIEKENEIFYCISLASPLGKILNNKKVGEKVIFQGKEITIIEII